MLLVLAGLSPAFADATALDIRFGVQEDRTRVVIDLTEPVEARVFLLPSPTRVVIDLPRVAWHGAPSGTGIRHVLGYRFGQFDPSTARVVLDTAGPVTIASTFVLPSTEGRPTRLVIDLVATDETSFRAEANRIVALATPAVPAEKALPVPSRRVVVVDPGHGGNDPGAAGMNGMYEKHLTLAMARRLRDVLEATGRYDVVLTRNDDTYIALRERVALARRAGAELFISLHADSLDNSQVRGASVYTLSDTASDKEAELLAAKENQSDIIAGLELAEDPEVVSILIDLARRETMNQSRRFAVQLVATFDGNVRLLPKAHRYAGFAVLKAPDVPSVLIEMGYLSNPQDATLLQKPEHQKRLAELVRDAVDAYFARVGSAPRT